MKITPDRAQLAFGTQAQFAVTYDGLALVDAVWNATGGTITEMGLYTAGTETGLYTVTVSSPSHPGEEASAEVAVGDPCSAVGGERYCVRLLPPPSSVDSTAYRLCGKSINDQGQVTGDVWLSSGPHAFLYDGATLTNLGTTFGDARAGSYGRWISSDGLVVGMVFDGVAGPPGRAGPATFTPAISRLPWPAGWTDEGSRGDAVGANSSGDVVGTVSQLDAQGAPVLGSSHAVVWRSGQLEVIPLPESTTQSATQQARAINDAGQVVATCYDCADATAASFLFAQGALTPLPGRYTGTNPVVEAKAISANGIVAGFESRPNGLPSWESLAIVWEDGQPRYVHPQAPFTQSTAVAVNDQGTVVGTVSGPPGSGASEAAVSVEGSMVRVSELIAPDTGLTDISLNGINNLGQIVGCGTYTPPGARAYGAAFILLPITQ